MYFANF